MASKQEIIDNFAKWWPYAMADTNPGWIRYIKPAVERMYTNAFGLQVSDIPTKKAAADPGRTIDQVMGTFMDTLWGPVAADPETHNDLIMRLLVIGWSINRGRSPVMHNITVGIGVHKTTGEPFITRDELTTRDMCEDKNFNVLNVFAFGSCLTKSNFLEIMKKFPRDRIFMAIEYGPHTVLTHGPNPPAF